MGVDWHAILIPQHPIAEVVARGTLIYFLLFFTLRFFMNRQAGAIGIPDLLVVVLIVEATTDALGRNESVTEAAVLIATVMLWSYGLQWLAFRFPRLEFLVASPRVKLIENGRMLRRNMRRELVTEEELNTLLRVEGIEDISRVKLACLESSGDVSVVKYDEDQDGGSHTNRSRTVS